MTRPAFSQVVRTLARLHRAEAPAPFAGAWRAILWENVAYLAEDEKRLGAFQRLEREVGLRAEEILAAPGPLLRSICGAGILAEAQARKLRRCAELLQELCGGDPARLVRGTRPEVRRRLKRFPGIGEPGADRIQLFALGRAVPSFESNGLRTLQRIGFGPADGSYATVYRAVVCEIEREGPHPGPLLKTAWAVLRRHGQQICRRSGPRCETCPLAGICRHAVALRTAARARR